MNPRGKRTPHRPATAMVITTGSAIRPRKALGKPNTWACHDVATVPQLTTELRLQDSAAPGSAARRTASTDSTNAASRLRQAEKSMVPKIQARECRILRSVARDTDTT